MSQLTRNVRSPKGWRKKPKRRRRTTVSTRRAAPHRPSKPTRRRKTRKPLRLPRISLSRRLLGRLIVIGLVLAISGATFLTFAIASLSRNLPEPGRLIDRNVAISTKIYDRKGETLLYDLHGEAKRTLIALDQIAPLAIKAALVAEDRNFYEHTGFDLRGIIRSVFLNIFKGGPLRGGSTITQQFTKNAVLTREKTLTRKLKELVLAYKIEKRFSKDEILNMYFNEIPYGSTIYGIESAAQSFFGKSASELDVVEGAMLAALPKAPTRLSPYGNHPDELVGRVQHIVKGMADEGYITKEEADKYSKEDVLGRVKPRRDSLLAPHFVLYVREQLVQEYGEDFIERGGLKVTTTLDWDLQQIAEKEVLEGAKRNEERFGGNNAALFAQDVKTGQILAMVGSRDYFDEEVDGNVNVTLRARQPGSSFKPIVYTTAFTRGFTADTPLWDVVTNFKVEPEDYEPHNYDDKENGLVPMRKALAGSLNIPAVKTIYLTGIEHVLDLAERLGYTTFGDRSRFGLSLVLGGGEVKLAEHVGAFATLANDGVRIPQSTILRIEDSSGRVLEKWKSTSGEQVIDSTVTREIVNILSDNNARAFMFGVQNPLTLPDRPVAAKTGTTNDFRDAWTLGFTPSIAAGVWAGNNNNSAMHGKAAGANVAAPIWQAFMSQALQDSPVEEFLKPDPRPTLNPILRGQGITSTEPHSLLFYIDKDNLNASRPENPNEDPNFETWEQAIHKYLGLEPTEAELKQAADALEQELQSEITSPFTE